MPLSLPTLQDLRTTCRSNFAARLAGADTTLRRSVINISADIMAGGMYSFFRALGWMSKQLFIDSAEDPYLDRRLADYGLTRTPAATASGSVTFAGASTTPIPIGTQLQTSDQSQQYVTVAAGTISGSGSGTVVIAIVAQNAGSGGNQVSGVPLNLMTAIAGVNPVAIVTSAGLTGGTDQESDASFRARGLARIREPPQGGAGSDFWAWARASGIPTRAWVYPLNRGPGTCDIAFTIDTRSNPIPLSADLTAVLDYVEPLAPVIGDYQCFAPVADTQTVTIANMSPGDSGTQALVTAAVLALYASVPPGGATYGDGVTEALTDGALFPIQVPGKLYISQIEAAIESVGTIVRYDLTAPASDVTFASGHLPAKPTVTFT